MNKQQLSEKNKKSEILDAYNRLLKEVKKEKIPDPKHEKQIAEEEIVIEDNSKIAVQDIVKDITNVKLNLNQSLDELEEEMLNEHKKFLDLQRAIKISKSELKEIHEISVNIDSLDALIRSQHELKQNFGKEMNDKKTKWQRDLEELEKKFKDKEAKLTQERIREEEEHKYNTKITRQRDKDDYESRKQTLENELIVLRDKTEKELKEREEQLSAQEQDLVKLREENATFPAQLKQKVEEVKKQTRDEVEKKYRFEIDLNAKAVEGEQKLFEQKILALEAKIKEQEQHIEQLRRTTKEANQQAQSIAIKAIEGGSAFQHSLNFHKQPVPQE